jgi:hypothetical protein
MQIHPTSLVTRSEPARQRIEVDIEAPRPLNGTVLTAFRDADRLAEMPLGDLAEGPNECVCLLPVPETPCEIRWVLSTPEGTLAETVLDWTPLRDWTLYMISSTHTDIGLHNSPYIQRHSNVENVEKVAALIDQTADRGDDSCYRYVIEGTWVWGNYERDRSEETAQDIAEKYVKPGKLGIGAAMAGNHTQTYGFEELCRSAYTRRALLKRWGVPSSTMTMIDNNGICWSLVSPYADAGFRNVFFAPNQWNPLDSTLNPMDKTKDGARWNPDANGGGSRVDVRWDSDLPMVFYWQGADDTSRLLVWASTQYGHGGAAFGIGSNRKEHPATPDSVAPILAKHLAKLEARYPYDVWLFASYGDDEPPNLYLADFAAAWNAEWRSPTFRLTGDLDEPYDKLRAKFGDQIQTLRGDITSGWSQHPICAPELLAQKFAADRLLPTAEKLASLARMFEPSYIYPATEFRRAWDALICNDEHSYGTSGYQGRRVYETWMQHRDWIDKAERTAVDESRRALDVLASKIAAAEKSLVLFNPTLVPRTELLTVRGAKLLTPEVPSFGYITVPCSRLVVEEAEVATPEEPPVVENEFYRVTFAADGSMASIFDKELGRELLDPEASFRANQFVYTKDNHQTFTSPENATFEIQRDSFGQTVVVKLDDPHSRAAIVQRVTLPNHTKQIEIDNQLSHVFDQFNTHRYYRYGYYAFPFEVEDGTFRAQLNGCIASPKTDQTGHGTDAYLPARDWTCVENGEFGVALLQLDSHLVEFGRIHPDKTEFGEPFGSSHLYSYLFTDWLQMHTTGGSAINPRFRYVIASYAGDYRTAGISQLAERLTQPLLTTSIPAQDGSLPSGMSFLEVDKPNVSLLTLKLAETPGQGFIARLHELDGIPIESLSAKQDLGSFELTACSLLEENREELATVPIPGVEMRPSPGAEPAGRRDAMHAPDEQATPAGCGRDARAPRGTAPTSDLEMRPSPGAEPAGRRDAMHAPDEQATPAGCGRDARAPRGAAASPEFDDRPDAPDISLAPFGYATIRFKKPATAQLAAPAVTVHEVADNQLSLSWKPVVDAAQYHIYRGAFAGFEPDEYHLHATTLDTSFVDRNLSPGTTYWYRVAAVDANANQGTPSKELAVTTEAQGPSAPAKVGSFYSGLIDAPRAGHGAEPDQLYVVWGQNIESDLSHYELYRSEEPGFTPDEATFVADIEPGPYCVGLRDDRGLKVFTAYYYRVRAVDTDGNKGEFSDEFSWTTREPYDV